MREQLLKGKASLAGMRARYQFLRIRIRRWTVQVLDCIGERWHAELFRDRGGQQLCRRHRTHASQCLVGEIAQATLLHTLGGRVYRCQRVGACSRLVLPYNTILGMDHFETGLAAAHFAKTGEVYTGLELRLLLPGEMKKSQGKLPAAIADADQQIATTAKQRFGKQHLTCDQATGARLQRTQAHELRSIFVTQRQQE